MWHRAFRPFLLSLVLLLPLGARSATLEAVPISLESAMLQAVEGDFEGTPASEVVSESGSVDLSWDFAFDGNGGSASASIFEDEGGLVFEWSGSFTREASHATGFFVDGPIGIGLVVPDYGGSTTPLLFRFTAEENSISSTSDLGFATIGFYSNGYESAVAGVAIEEFVSTSLYTSLLPGNTSAPSNILVDLLAGDSIVMETGDALDGIVSTSSLFQGGGINGGETLTFSQRMRLDVFAVAPGTVPEPGLTLLLIGAGTVAAARRGRRQAG